MYNTKKNPENNKHLTSSFHIFPQRQPIIGHCCGSGKSHGKNAVHYVPAPWTTTNWNFCAQRFNGWGVEGIVSTFLTHLSKGGKARVLYSGMEEQITRKPSQNVRSTRNVDRNRKFAQLTSHARRHTHGMHSSMFHATGKYGKTACTATTLWPRDHPLLG